MPHESPYGTRRRRAVSRARRCRRVTGTGATRAEPALSAEAAGRFAALALKCLHQEYPNHVSHTLAGDADARPPRELTPAFYGCFDWHSDVHGHWLLVRLLRLFPAGTLRRAGARGARRAASPRRTSHGEVAYLRAAGRASFERPYGLAWLLKLARGAAQLGRCRRPRRWSATLQAAGGGGRGAHQAWVPKLHYPDPHRRARPDRLLVRPDLGLGGRCAG